MLQVFCQQVERLMHQQKRLPFGFLSGPYQIRSALEASWLGGGGVGRGAVCGALLEPFLLYSVAKALGVVLVCLVFPQFEVIFSAASSKA